MSDRITIGIILGNANSPHTIETIKGIREAAKEKQVNIMCYAGVHSSYFFKDYFELKKEEDFDYQATCVYDYIALSNVDALIVSYGTLSVFLDAKEVDKFFKKIKEIPTIVLENRMEGSNTAYVIANNYKGMKLIMNHLLDYHGYSNVAYLSGPIGNRDADERRQAFIDSVEEYNIPFRENMIAYGDFSERVEKQVNCLLDDNPDIDALVCANDKMAQTVYDVLEQRKKLYYKAVAEGDAEGERRYYKHLVGQDIINGHGIAVTGYDNVSSAENMDPPLTTIVQNAYANGYNAVISAVDLIDTKIAKNIVAEPREVIRNSCGCAAGTRLDFVQVNEYYRMHPDIYAAQIAESFRNGILISDVNEKISDGIYDGFYKVVYKYLVKYVGIDDTGISDTELFHDLKDIIDGEYAEYISLTSFTTAISDYLMVILKGEYNLARREKIVEAISRIIEFVHSKIFIDATNMVGVYEHRTWFLPLISRDMTNYLESPKDMYRNAMTKMSVLGMGNTYLYMMKEPVKHRLYDEWSCPDELYLVAYTKGEQVFVYDIDEAPVVNRLTAIDHYIDNQDAPYYASAINLYSGEYQYGLLVAETEPENVLSLYYASVQVSTALKYCEMSKAQKRLQSELENVINEVEQKNEILRSLSEYDQLTGCLNRRGFLERALDIIKENEDEKAVVLFADLDHLKEINDKYGHGDGDFAIENAAKIIAEALPEGSVVSRIGGDEFVALVIPGQELNSDMLVRNITDGAIRFNAVSSKPYYVECSVGTKDFICRKDIHIEDIISGADEALYEAKKHRRQSITKTVKIW